MIDGGIKKKNPFCGMINVSAFVGAVAHERNFSGTISVGERINKVIPYAVNTLKDVGGRYRDSVYFMENGANDSYTEFLVGEFPLEQKFEWVYHWGYDTAVGTKKAELILQIMNLERSPNVGDFIKLRYVLPEITRCKFYNTDSVQASMYKDPDYYTLKMELVSNGSNGGKPALFVANYNGQKGTSVYYEYAQIYTDKYEFLLSDPNLVPITDDTNFLGFELTGRLMCPVDEVKISITGHSSGGYNNADLFVKYNDLDCFIMEAYK
jgi:hypothetical protein